LALVKLHRPPPETDDERHEEELRERGREAFHAGRYDEAYNCFQSSALDLALRWFREEGLVFQRPPNKLTAMELLIGLAIAANGELESQGEAASNKLSAATWLFNAVAELRIALEEHVPATKEAVGLKMAEMTSRGVMLGQIDMIMTAIRLGWLDKLAEYEVARERRRAGAEKVNAAKATVKERAMGEAIRIAGRNPTLSNEELARRIIDAAGLNTTIRTATDWVREWRRRELLRAQKAT
jgi:hypothetical protein